MNADPQRNPQIEPCQPYRQVSHAQLVALAQARRAEVQAMADAATQARLSNFRQSIQLAMDAGLPAVIRTGTSWHRDVRGTPYTFLVEVKTPHYLTATIKLLNREGAGGAQCMTATEERDVFAIVNQEAEIRGLVTNRMQWGTPPIVAISLSPVMETVGRAEDEHDVCSGTNMNYNSGRLASRTGSAQWGPGMTTTEGMEGAATATVTTTGIHMADLRGGGASGTCSNVSTTASISA